MKKRLFFTLIAIACLLIYTVGVSAQLFSVGESSDNNLVEISNTGILSGNKASYEVFATGDTLTVVESGKTCVLDTSSTAVVVGPTFTLPSAVVGLHYYIVAGNDNYVIVRPNIEDKIKYLTLDTGDAIRSPKATADSVHLVCGGANTWYVAEMFGTWTDYAQ